jgi:hypothetical protein
MLPLTTYKFPIYISLSLMCSFSKNLCAKYTATRSVIHHKLSLVFFSIFFILEGNKTENWQSFSKYWHGLSLELAVFSVSVFVHKSLCKAHFFLEISSKQLTVYIRPSSNSHVKKTYWHFKRVLVSLPREELFRFNMSTLEVVVTFGNTLNWGKNKDL